LDACVGDACLVNLLPGGIVSACPPDVSACPADAGACPGDVGACSSDEGLA
jgi:hypothetical protein